MNKKNLYLACMLLLSSAWAMAQSSGNGPASFAILGGVNFQTFNGQDANDEKLENDLRVGFHAGISAQLPLAPEFYFQPGLLFSTKGAKNETVGFTSTFKLSYVEVPLNLVYRASLGSGHFSLGFGPYVGFGIAGKALTEGNGVNIEQDVEFTNEVAVSSSPESTYFRRLDAGGNVFVSYEMASGIFLQLNTQLGLVKINPEYEVFPNDDSTIKNTGFGLSLGYRL